MLLHQQAQHLTRLGIGDLYMFFFLHSDPVGQIIEHFGERVPLIVADLVEQGIHGRAAWQGERCRDSDAPVAMLLLALCSSWSG